MSYTKKIFFMLPYEKTKNFLGKSPLPGHGMPAMPTYFRPGSAVGLRKRSQESSRCLKQRMLEAEINMENKEKGGDEWGLEKLG